MRFAANADAEGCVCIAAIGGALLACRVQMGRVGTHGCEMATSMCGIAMEVQCWFVWQRALAASPGCEPFFFSLLQAVVAPQQHPGGDASHRSLAQAQDEQEEQDEREQEEQEEPKKCPLGEAEILWRGTYYDHENWD